MNTELPKPDATSQKYYRYENNLQPCFDELVRLAAQICQTPIAFIRWVNREGQWIHSQVGLEAKHLGKITFNLELERDELCIIRETLASHRVANSPLVTSDPYVRFYAGISLGGSENLTLGELCVCDYIPRDLNLEQQEALKILSHQAIAQIELQQNLYQFLREKTEHQYAESALYETYDDLQQTLEPLQVAHERQHQQQQELSIRSEAAHAETQIAQKQIVNILETISDAFFAVDNQWKFIYLNQQAEHLLYRKREDLIGKNLWQEFPASVNCQFYQEYHKAVAEKTSVFFEAFYPPLATWFEVHAHPCEKGLSVYFHNINPRKQAEEKIREQAALLDIATDAIIVQSLDHKILFWNKGAEHLYGVSATDAIGKDVEQLLYQGISEQLQQALKAILETGDWQGELCQFNQQNKPIIVQSRWTLVRDEQNQPKSILVVNTDITQKKQLEAQFLRAQRLESIGTLASGISHDLNNVLAPIQMVVQLLEKQLKDAHSQHLLDILRRNVQRGADLVKQVLSFGRGLESRSELVQINYLIREIRQIIKQTFPKGIEVCVETESDLWMIWGDVTQLHQVLMNLCVNARDAMPDGGTLTLSASNFEVDEQYAKMNLDAAIGSYLVLTVADTGTGIAPEVLNRIFDPFFTTKDVGKGTGLGLSTVINIINNHNGFLKVDSQVGKGTEFKVYLPAVKVDLQDRNEIPIGLEKELPKGNGELILVIDDEPTICEITQHSLECCNYKVITASNGVEAVDLYAKHYQNIHLVLTDIMMPQMDGLRTIQALQHINPNVKIIAASGLASSESVSVATHCTVKAFLPKPFTAQDLLETLKNVLAE